jgi:hypothetical protein
VVVRVLFSERFFDSADDEAGGVQNPYGCHIQGCKCFLSVFYIVFFFNTFSLGVKKIQGCLFIMNPKQRLEYEQIYKKHQLEEYFATRKQLNQLVADLPRLDIGEVDCRARARGVYILSNRRQSDCTGSVKTNPEYVCLAPPH